MRIEFREISHEIFNDFIELEVKPDQKNNFYFKSTKPNVMTLAQAYIHREETVVSAIFADDMLVGSIFYCPSSAPIDHGREAWLTRLMIDQRYQGKGYGRAAMELLFQKVLEHHKGEPTRLGLSYELHNTTAENLYASLGFRASGDMLGDQVVLWKDLQ